MIKFKHTAAGSDIYKLIRQVRMSDADRELAIHALRKAEAIVDAVLWVKGMFSTVGNYFLKPSLKS
jgi:hypothetical protein